MTRDLPRSIRPVLGYLVGLLGSDKDGEALGAARAIDRKLRASGCDFHDLGALVAGTTPAVVETVRPPAAPWRRTRAPTVYVDLGDGPRAALLSTLEMALAGAELRGWDRCTLAALWDRLNDSTRRPTQNAIERVESILAGLQGGQP